MASNLRRVRRDFVVPVAVERKRFKRIDDPELALEVAARREKNNLSAIRSGLPAVGSKLVNRYGLEFEVESHVHVPTANSVQRWREGSQTDADLFPSIIPQNLSLRLTSFVAAVDRCTTKTLLVLDTMPHARRDSGVPDGHWVDTIGNGGANLLFIDAAQIHETHFAHEIGHLWVQYVDQAEDDRVMEDVRDAGRLHQLSFVQSFVTDLRVNQVIAEKGFDVSVIVEDQAASIASLGRAIEAGYRPENPREGVFMALALAVQILEEQKTGSNTLAKLEVTLEKVTRHDPELARLATGFADAVTRHGFQQKDQNRASVDECLKLAFDYSGDAIDLERDLVIPPIREPDFDKYPQWIEGASPQMKCEVGRIMAREDIPDGSRWSISQGPLNASHLTFELPDGTIKGPWTLVHSQAFATRIDHILRINEMNRQNRERQMKHQPNGMPNFPGQPRRFYMAGTARFLTRVREAEWLGGEHPYAYAMNNPVTYTDPSGLSPKPTPPNVFCSCDPVKVHGVKKGKGKDSRYNCYFSACADYCQALDDAAKDARTTCEDGGILGAPGYNNSFPVCNAESDYWQECGLRITTPGGSAYNGANANHSNYPYPAYQIAIGAPYCLVECTMRLCCASLQASDPKSSLKQAIKNCRKKYG
jgi:RHS repeat-associated protein